ncbi:unnamed protein product [Callosobruchus maculatus]|uniref:Uncharacterized protein n=1 Tax=Callosobruchus maculatus TaxID=64391 RepID=A0A653CXX5_CALMS|nr:unnamed protein product [Callosobruchus maculatus]
MFKKKFPGDVGGIRKKGKWGKLEELVLPNAKLRFCPEQLQNLNFVFNKRLQKFKEAGNDKSLALAKSVTERLVQRLLCSVGSLDSRFASKFLIRNEDESSIYSNTLDYIVRLDCLSTPSLYDSDTKPRYSVIEEDTDCPAAYARLKLQAHTLKTWSDFVNGNGYLRRDKVQARLVELLASAASRETPSSPLHVDESSCCGLPGKVVDSYTLYNILKISPQKHVYYGPGGNVPRFPDPRDFRLAIVDEPEGVRMRVEFLSPALNACSIEVRLLVAIGLDAWPSTTDFPARVPLGHADCLLYHQAAQTGMYLVGYGVQSSAWQIRLPATEYAIINHYGPNSTVRTVLNILYGILDDVDHARKTKRQQVSYKILNKYIFRTLLLEELEEGSKTPVTDMINWSPMYLSTHVLNLLDKIIPKLTSERHSNYFFKKANLLVNPGHLSDDDFTAEAHNVKVVLVRLFDESLMSSKMDEEFHNMILAQESEMSLLHKWRDLIEGLLPPPGTRGRRFCFAGSKNRQDVAHTQYTMRQLEYIGLLLKKMLSVKQSILHTDHTCFDQSINMKPSDQDQPLDDIIFILVDILDQARDQYLSSQTNPNILKNKLKINNNYCSSTAKLVDLMRKDKDLQNLNLEDDMVLVKTILKWLYKAMDYNKRYLGPLLRPYLSNLFAASHAISWHIDSIKKRASTDELEALGTFAELVNSGKITPAQGLVDAVNKDWNWAKSMLAMVEKSTLRVVFIEERSKVYRHILSLPSYQKKEIQAGSKTLDVTVSRSETRTQNTLPNCYFNSILTEKNDRFLEDGVPQHDYYKFASPLTFILRKRHRRGEHRGGGDIFKALASMQKLSMFQEVTSTLPSEDRIELTELIQNVQNSRPRRLNTKRWSGTLPQSNSYSRLSQNGSEPPQRYIPKEESAGIKICDRDEMKTKNQSRSTASLIGTCRAARIREDSSVFYLQDSFKIKSLLNKSDSFKY